MRRLWGVIAVVLVTLGMLIVGQPAHADGDAEATRFDVSIAPQRDGQINVTVDLDMNYHSAARGFFFVLPNKLTDPVDNKRYRLLSYRNFAVTDAEGRRVGASVESSGTTTELRVGDPNRKVRGKQSYKVAFTMSGSINPRVGDTDEFSWNPIGNFEFPISNISMNVTMPATISRTECTYGNSRSSARGCLGEQVAGTNATWSIPKVDAGGQVTVTLAVPQGTFSGPYVAPQYEQRVGVDTMLEATPVSLAGGGVAALAGILGVVVLTRGVGRDRQFAGLTPGLTPTGGAAQPVTKVRGKVPVAVRFTPPDGALPGQIGTLIDEVADLRDISATLIHLAVRGYLRYETEPTERFVRLSTDTSGLTDYEATLIAELFGRSDIVDLTTTDRMANAISHTTTKLYEEVRQLGWFRENPRVVRWKWLTFGVFITLVGAALTMLLGIAFSAGLIGVGVAVAGVALMIGSRFMPSRTPLGTAMQQQAEGFKLYLATAEVDQLKFEEGEDIFSKYLPWAMAFDVVDHWTTVCAELAARGYRFDTSWYVGAYPIWYNPMAFTSSMTHVTGAMQSSLTTSVNSSGFGGGSSFGGGLGGGVGGMGGGTW